MERERLGGKGAEWEEGRERGTEGGERGEGVCGGEERERGEGWKGAEWERAGGDGGERGEGLCWREG